MESTVSDFEMVKNLRNARIAAVQAAQAGQLPAVLADSSDSLTKQVYVVKLLDVTPGLGKVSGRRLLADIGVNPFAQVSDLTPEQKDKILRAAGEAA